MEKFSFSSWFQGIKGRLLFAAFLPVVGFAILGAVSYKGVSQIISLLDVANQTIIPTFDTLGEMRQARQKFGYQVWAALGTPDADARKKRIESAKSATQEFVKGEESYAGTLMEGEEAKLFENTRPAIKEFVSLMNQVTSLLESGTEADLATVKNLMDTKIIEVETQVKNWNVGVKTMYQKLASDGVKEAGATQKSVNNTLMFVTLFAAFAIFGLLLWLASKISNSVSGISNKLTIAGSQVATSVEQLNEAGNSLSQSSTEAAASLEETVAALEELTSMVQMNSDNAKQAASLSITSREAAERGEQEIHSLIESMKVISQSSKKIEEIISVIDDIAFQTNLLALNAAVEAARAGEQGKGFAVVAEAVRTLAQRSAEAAKDITTLIKDSVSQIEDGRKIADQSGTVLSNITNSVKKVSDLNNEIAAASAEQTTGIQQIGKAMNQLDQSSQSNAASAEEIAATSGEISNLAVATQQLTHDLNGVILGAGAKSMEVPHLESRGSAKKPMASQSVAKKSPAGHNPKNVVSFKRPTAHKAAKSQAVDAIPFDEDDRAKVGTTDGF